MSAHGGNVCRSAGPRDVPWEIHRFQFQNGRALVSAAIVAPVERALKGDFYYFPLPRTLGLPRPLFPRRNSRAEGPSAQMSGRDKEEFVLAQPCSERYLSIVIRRCGRYEKCARRRVSFDGKPRTRGIRRLRRGGGRTEAGSPGKKARTAGTRGNSMCRWFRSRLKFGG